MPSLTHHLTWLEPGRPFPAVCNAWGAYSKAPGLLAAGGDLSTDTLRQAYSNGIFPWFSDGQPILWWSPDPRMTLEPANFRLHRSLRKTLQRFKNDARCEIRFNSAFTKVIRACADRSQYGQSSTWILPSMEYAYTQLHREGYAHSVETWINGELVGGLYCVALGQSVFGESMFTKVNDASKIALAALVAFSREHGISLIDCQQNTAHLASMGATEMRRERFLEQMTQAQTRPPLTWCFDPLYWQHLVPV